MLSVIGVHSSLTSLTTLSICAILKIPNSEPYSCMVVYRAYPRFKIAQMLKVVKEVNDECTPITENILADPNMSSRQCQTGGSLPSESSPRGIPQALEGTVDEKRGGKTPNAPQHRAEGANNAHWIPVMCPRQTDASKETVPGSAGELSHNGHR
jgi:hypothetical protein